MKIFISIANYRDPEIKQTVMSAINNAKNPENLYFGIFSQISKNEKNNFSDVKNLKEVIIPYQKSLGVGHARSEIQKLFTDQQYFLQIDAHCLFIKDWDSKIINIYNKIKTETGNDKVIISSWGIPYSIDSKSKEIFYNSNIPQETKNKNFKLFPHYMKIKPFLKSWTGDQTKIEDGLIYHESETITAQFIFASKEIISEVPYDKDIPWSGEEITYAIRAYTRGWKIYSTYDNFIFHNYIREKTPKPSKDLESLWNKMHNDGRIRSAKILLMKEDFEIFGIGSRQLYNEYINRFRPNFIKETEDFLKELESL
jgi:hypothetical protein